MQSVLLLLLAAPATVGTAAAQESQPDPPRRFVPDEVVQQGCKILLELQEGDGRREWPYEGVYRVREPGSATDVIPIGYRVGGTAIACLALIAAPGYGDAANAERREAVARGVAFILEALDLPLMEPSREDTYDVRGWGFVYALELLTTLEARGVMPALHAAAARKAILRLIQALEETALEKVGGWNYAGRDAPAPFMTAPALAALFAASARGYAVSKPVVNEALASLERGRAASGSIAYTTPGKSRAEVGEEELGFMDKLPGSIGRMLAAESTLMLAGRGDRKRLSIAVESFFTHWNELEVRRKQPGTHVRPYGVAPYYVFYGHFQAARAIELLADPDERELGRNRLRELLSKIQEPEGGWNDRVFARSRNFGTAMGILALLQPALPPPPRWKGTSKAR